VITVQVVSDDANQLATDLAPKELFIDDSVATVGTFVGSIAQPSVGSNGSQWSYFVDKSAREEFPFYVNAASGDVFVVGHVNATLKSVYEVNVDIGSDLVPAQTTRLVVRVTGAGSGSRPKFPTDPILVRVPENSRIGTRILTVRPEETSAPRSWPLKFEIAEPPPAEPVLFAVGEKTGELKLTSALDHEKMPSHLLTVRVSADDELFSTLLTVVVVVEDVNDVQPTFLSSDSVEISADTPLGTPFFSVIAADDDSGDFGVVKYVIRDGNGDGVFVIDGKSGQLSLQKLPAAGKLLHRLTIRAEDGGQLYADQILNVRIRQDSTAAPKFVEKKMTVKVSENLPPNSRVAVLQVPISLIYF
jgi:hypothetical protein